MRIVEMKNIIVGTAGHIDHGKTALVRALTGIDTDRLKEEKQRGISIHLGFAHLQLSPGVRLGLVDVPGQRKVHQKHAGGCQRHRFCSLCYSVRRVHKATNSGTFRHLYVVRHTEGHRGPQQGRSRPGRSSGFGPAGGRRICARFVPRKRAHGGCERGYRRRLGRSCATNSQKWRRRCPKKTPRNISVFPLTALSPCVDSAR